jgi:ParB family chromosome partitioning protein
MAAKFENSKGRKDMFYFDPDTLVMSNDPTDPLYDPRMDAPINEHLVLSIMSQGITTPILIKKQGGRPVVIDGRQRVRCAREANRRLREAGADPITIPCDLKAGDDIDLYSISLTANEHRLDDDPMTKAAKAARLSNSGKMDEEIAVIFGVSLATVKSWTKLFELAKPVRDAVKAGKIAASAAIKLYGLPEEEQKAALEEALATAKPEETGEPRKKRAKVSSKVAAAVARSAKAKATGKRPKSVRRKDEVEAVIAAHPDAGFIPILKWFLGAEFDFEAASKE